jgi:hypothetical protein
MAAAGRTDDYNINYLEILPADEQLGELITIIEDAQNEGVLLPLPSAESEVVESAEIEARITTVNLRLNLLGYIHRPDPVQVNGQVIIDNRLKNAIQRFQRDAQLTVDGWVGPQTWGALDELVSFEAPVNMADWLAKPAVQPAVERAVALRLFALGFLEKNSARGSEVIEGLHGFAQIVNKLLLRPEEAPLPVVSGEFDARTLNMLFNEDDLVVRLAQVPDQARWRLKIGREWRLWHRFRSSIAKVELWLLGYEVKPNREDTRRFRILHHPDQRDLHHRLYQFWRAVSPNLNRLQARWRARRVSQAFFQNLLVIVNGAEFQVVTPISPDQLFEEIEALKNENATPVLSMMWESLKSLGSRIWDGLRRVWNWLSLQFKRVQETLRARNLARLLNQFAVETFTPLWKMVQGLNASIRFVLPLTFEGSQPPRFLIGRTRMFDYCLHDDRSGGEQDLLTVTRQMHQHADEFRVTFPLIGVVLKAVLQAIRAVYLPGVGWFAFFMGLLRAYKSVQAAVLEYQQIAGVTLSAPRLVAS